MRPALARWATPGALAALAAIVTFAVFSEVITLDFISYDDPLYITARPEVWDGLTWQSAEWAFTGFGAINYHPITWLSHLLDVEIFAGEAWGHHLTSLLFHAVNAGLAVMTAHALFRRLNLAVIVGLVFALHPQRVESVAWVSERKDVLSGFFFLLMLWSWVEGHRRDRPILRLLAVAAFVLGLLSKPMLVTAPAVLILVDVAFLGRGRGALALLRVVGEKLPLFFLSALESWATLLAQTNTIQENAVVSIAARLQNAFLSTSRYVEKLFVPRDLSPIYVIHPEEWTPLRMGGAGLVIVGCTALAVWLARRSLVPLAGWLWFLGMLVPVLGLVQVGAQSMADRYTYLPHLGLLIFTISSLDLLVQPARARRALAFFVAGWLVVCAGLARAQIEIWRSTESMWRWALEIDPENASAHGLLASVCLNRGDLACGLQHSAWSMRLGGNGKEFGDEFAIALLRTGRLEMAERTIRTVIGLDPKPGHFRVWGDIARARGDWRTALWRYGIARSMGERVDYELGICHLETGELALAQAELERVVAEKGPGAAGPRYQLARVFIAEGAPDKARPLLEEARAVAAEHADNDLVGKIDAVLGELAR